MNRSELKKYFIELTPTEQMQKNKKEPKLSPFYDYLESIGLKNKNNIYHLPESHFVMPNYKNESTIWDKLDNSPRQEFFRFKKATRYAIEPFSYADFIAIRYVYSGQVAIITPDTTFNLNQNDVCLLNSRFVLSQQLNHDEDVVFTMMFEKDYLIGNVLKDLKESGIVTRFIIDYILNNKNSQNYIIFHGETNDRISNVIEDMLCEFIDSTPYGEVLIDSYVKILLIEMMNSDYDYSKTQESHHSIQLAKILNYLDEHYMTCSLENLGKEFNFNSKYLSRLIKTYTGKNYKDIILEKKMEQVCLMLSNSDLSINQIIERNGFNNETYFYKKFKDKYGVYPKEFRETTTIN